MIAVIRYCCNQATTSPGPPDPRALLLNTFVFHRIINVLRRLAEIEESVQHLKGPFLLPDMTVVESDGDPAKYHTAVFKALCEQYVAIRSPIMSRFDSRQKFKDSLLGPSLQTLRASDRTRESDEQLVRRAVDALDNRWLYFPVMSPIFYLHPSKDEAGNSINVEYGLLPKTEIDRIGDRFLFGCQLTSEARVIVDELTGLVQRLETDLPSIPPASSLPLDRLETMALHQRRRDSFIAASNQLVLEVNDLASVFAEYEQKQVEMITHWLHAKESGNGEHFLAEIHLDALEQAIYRFVEVFENAHHRRFLEEVDWEQIPKLHPRCLSPSEAFISFSIAREIVVLARRGESFRSQLELGWNSADLKSFQNAALRELPAFVGAILGVMARRNDYPRISIDPLETPKSIARLQVLMDPQTPWNVGRLDEFRFLFDRVAREHQRLHLSSRLPKILPDSCHEEVIRQLDEIASEILKCQEKGVGNGESLMVAGQVSDADSSAGEIDPEEIPFKEMQIQILEMMLQLGAVRESKSRTKKEVIAAINRNLDVENHKRDFRTLRLAKMTKFSPGPSGGIWLTSTGIKLAQHLTKINSAQPN